MNIIQDKVSFHDASLTGIRQEKDCLIFSLEDVSLDDNQIPATVTVSNITIVTRDGLQVACIRMETDDGEVLRLSIDDDVATLVVSWHKHAPRSQETHTYQMSGKRIRLNIDRA